MCAAHTPCGEGRSTIKPNVQRLTAGLVVVLVLAVTLAPPAAARTVEHRVRAGESLWLIAHRYGTTVAALRQANGLTGSAIHPGQVLSVPLSGATAFSGADLDLLARLVQAEAGGEPYAGQVAVAAVILNRLEHPLFPDTIPAVIYQPQQFEPVDNGWINLPAGAVAYRAVLDAVNGWDPSYGALYFFNPNKVTNAFLWSRPHTVTIGNHRFAR
ncbi:MAG TPA: cell wall hydrolase [Bacillota bacterium]